MSEMVSLLGVGKRYGAGGRAIVAVGEVTLSVERGEFVVITGPSGSGKTTLLNLIGGMTRPDAGSVRVGGEDVLSMSDARLSRFRAGTIGFVFQLQSMLPTLSVFDNARLPQAFAGGGRDDGRVRELLAEVGLAERAGAFSDELSAGQQRRVAIARALVNRPALLLCDEPTGDLDPDTEAAIMKAMGRANQVGATVIMTTHNHALRSHATRSLRMIEGEIEEDETR